MHLYKLFCDNGNEILHLIVVAGFVSKIIASYKIDSATYYTYILKIQSTYYVKKILSARLKESLWYISIMKNQSKASQAKKYTMYRGKVNVDIRFKFAP